MQLVVAEMNYFLSENIISNKTNQKQKQKRTQNKQIRIQKRTQNKQIRIQNKQKRTRNKQKRTQNKQKQTYRIPAYLPSESWMRFKLVNSQKFKQNDDNLKQPRKSIFSTLRSGLTKKR